MTDTTRRGTRVMVIVLLWAGVYLRVAALGTMSTTMLHHDEAYNIVDAQTLMRDFQLTPFLPGNAGRESGWIYFLMPFLATLGRAQFAVRVAAATCGILTLAATYRLAAELFGHRVAVWALGALAVLYCHVHLSHLALRGQFCILVGALAAGMLLRAYRLNRTGAWAVSGVLLGSLVYTYFASTAWIGYFGLLLLCVLVADRRRRRGGALALAVAGLTVIPMVTYAVQNPELVLSRATNVAVDSLELVWRNAGAWGAALFERGDPNVLFNLPERPVLGPTLGVLAVLGVVGIVAVRRWRLRGLLVLGLGLATLAPSLVSDAAPHFLRGSGAVVPLALVLGIGAAVLSSATTRFLGGRMVAQYLPLVFLGAAGIVTYRDFDGAWMNDPAAWVAMEVHVNQAANFIAEETSPDTRVYLSPFTLAHPVVIVRAQDLAPRAVGAFDSHECMVVPDSPATAAYVSLTVFEPSFVQSLGQWAALSTLYEGTATAGGEPYYSIFQAETAPLDGEPVGRFDDQIEMQLLSAIPDAAEPGMTITITLGVRALRTLDVAPSAFVHLYGIPTPYEGGTMWSQADSQLCTSYPSHLWRTDETVVQTLVLPVPADAPNGDYQIGIGVYPFPDGTRLPVTEPPGNPHGYVPFKTLRIGGTP